MRGNRSSTRQRRCGQGKAFQPQLGRRASAPPRAKDVVISATTHNRCLAGTKAPCGRGGGEYTDTGVNGPVRGPCQAVRVKHTKERFVKRWMPLIIIGAILLIVFMTFSGRYNSLVGLQEGARAAWAQVENQYQRRADLIPNLVATVKGFAKQEREVLTEGTRLRSQWGKARASGNIGQRIQARRVGQRHQGRGGRDLARPLDQRVLDVDRDLDADRA